jgi:competence ComEA-like helix-hairpin-helix protein
VDIRWINDNRQAENIVDETPRNTHDALANTRPFQLPNQKKAKNVVYFYFNPNTISEDSLMLLGLSQKQASVFIKYRNAGAQFKKADDLDRIFSLSENDLKLLKPWVIIPTESAYAKEELKTQNDAKPTFVEKDIVVDINLADSAEFVKLKGIGPVLASRIIKYRLRFGAFQDIAQLLEVKDITKEWLEANKKNLIMSTLPPKKINLNTCTFDELKKHAYFDNDKAKTLINFRTHHGNFKYINEIKQCAAISQEFYNKIEPYISVNP